MLHDLNPIFLCSKFPSPNSTFTNNGTDIKPDSSQVQTYCTYSPSVTIGECLGRKSGLKITYSEVNTNTGNIVECLCY